MSYLHNCNRGGDDNFKVPWALDGEGLPCNDWFHFYARRIGGTDVKPIIEKVKTVRKKELLKA